MTEILQPGFVRVQYGQYSSAVPKMVGQTVRQVFERFRLHYNIPDTYDVRIDNSPASPDTIVQDQQTVSFLKPAGQKASAPTADYLAALGKDLFGGPAREPRPSKPVQPGEMVVVVSDPGYAKHPDGSRLLRVGDQVEVSKLEEEMVWYWVGGCEVQSIPANTVRRPSEVQKTDQVQISLSQIVTSALTQVLAERDAKDQIDQAAVVTEAINTYLDENEVVDLADVHEKLDQLNNRLDSCESTDISDDLDGITNRLDSIRQALSGQQVLQAQPVVMPFSPPIISPRSESVKKTVSLTFDVGRIARGVMLTSLLSLVAWCGARLYSGIRFDSNFSNYMAAAAATKDATKAQKYTDRAVEWLKVNNLTEGRTDVIFDGGPESDVSEWFNEVTKAATAITCKADNTEKIELPTPPSGLFASVAMYPLNKVGFGWFLSSLSGAVLGGLGWIVGRKRKDEEDC